MSKDHTSVKNGSPILRGLLKEDQLARVHTKILTTCKKSRCDSKNEIDRRTHSLHYMRLPHSPRNLSDQQPSNTPNGTIQGRCCEGHPYIRRCDVHRGRPLRTSHIAPGPRSSRRGSIRTEELQAHQHRNERRVESVRNWTTVRELLRVPPSLYTPLFPSHCSFAPTSCTPLSPARTASTFHNDRPPFERVTVCTIAKKKVPSYGMMPSVCPVHFSIRSSERTSCITSRLQPTDVFGRP